MLSINFSTDNDAFEGDNRPYEIERILTEVTKKIHGAIFEGNIKDINGNTIGNFEVT